MGTIYRIYYQGGFQVKRTEILRGLIDDTGLSLKAFSEKAGIPYTTLRSMLERGIGNASVDNVIKICKALGITIEELEEMANENREKKTKPNTIAAHLEGVELTKEEEEQLDDYIQFLLSRRKE